MQFLVVEDKEEQRKLIENTIVNTMFETKINYSVETFREYSKEFEKYMFDGKTKIYFLDIQVGDKSGIDIARRIREQANDLDSTIIFCTVHSELMYEILKARLTILTFIPKLGVDFKKEIKKTVQYIIDEYNKKQFMELEYNHTKHRIKINDILYIEKINNSNLSKIVTTKDNIITPKPLKQLLEELNFRFSHRACLVNPKRIYQVTENKIIFDNGTEIDLISKKYFVNFL